MSKPIAEQTNIGQRMTDVAQMIHPIVRNLAEVYTDPARFAAGQRYAAILVEPPTLVWENWDNVSDTGFTLIVTGGDSHDAGNNLQRISDIISALSRHHINIAKAEPTHYQATNTSVPVPAYALTLNPME